MSDLTSWLHEFADACEIVAAGRWPGPRTAARLREVADALAAAKQQGQAVAECHCATCTCAPGMTPAVRFDLSPAEKEGAIRDHLIALGWTPPNTAPPPSAPVGVEWTLSLLRAGHWREVYIGHRCMRLEVTYDYATWERLMAEVESALAPPPAAAEPKTLPVPTRVYLTDKAAVIVGDPQRGWDEEGPEAHNCDDMGCSTVGPHVLARVPFTDERALSQPADGEDIMVNTPYDVFTLPLRPSGLDGNGPRFVVHVPAPEQQPAAEALFMADSVHNQAMPGTREGDMVVLETDAAGKPTICCDPEIVDLVRDSACKCGEPVLIETGRYDLCRRDGKRPHYPESCDRTTVFRCRACSGWLGDTCPDAAFDEQQETPR